ncbi:peptidoglycan-binding protein [Streptomyces sp. AC512_CC834]|uniref:peptidoglycan-binding domain-containing protein n=1 Tax=Streptomyces sp. AC512_CC834 TaxID=2823691 RepID=UPI0020B8F99A|nr:peptidoglycan-binding domain-containing protein [Streptomyces sp. AC512_CC834]
MQKLQGLRVKAGAVTGLMLLSGLGLGIATATPAAAYAGWCNDGYATTTRTISSYTYTAYLPGYNGNADCYMNPGAQSKSVAMLQRSLNVCYNRSLTIDGVFGNNTRNALVYAQDKENISADGGYGEQTRKHLRWEFTRGGSLRCVRL